MYIQNSYLTNSLILSDFHSVLLTIHKTAISGNSHSSSYQSKYYLSSIKLLSYAPYCHTPTFPKPNNLQSNPWNIRIPLVDLTNVIKSHTFESFFDYWNKIAITHKLKAVENSIEQCNALSALFHRDEMSEQESVSIILPPGPCICTQQLTLIYDTVHVKRSSLLFTYSYIAENTNNINSYSYMSKIPDTIFLIVLQKFLTWYIFSNPLNFTVFCKTTA